MKRLIFVCLGILMILPLSAQDAKRVYITLDVSGSMSGNKYALANYTTQMIVTLCDDDDDVYMIVYGEEECLSKIKNPLQAIQKPMGSLIFGNSRSGSQFDDIIEFNKIYNPSEKKQNWLFIIGDGIWATETKNYKKDRELFRDLVSQGTLNVCYLQTGEKIDENNDFTEFAHSLGVVDIGKSDVKPSTIKKGCDHFARKILGFSETPLTVKKTGGKSINIQAELPLKGFYLVYQDQVTPEKLPQISNVTFSGKSLQTQLKGIPTTTPLKTRHKEVDLSGHVYHVRDSKIIPANAAIDVSFDKDIDPANVMVYPIVDEIEFGSVSLTRVGTDLKQLNSRTSSICRDESKAVVRIELSGESAANLPEALLKKTRVVVKANNKDYKTEFKDGAFECEIDIIDEETQYYAECDCPGYFKRVTPIMKIVKGDCPPEKPVNIPVSEMPTSDLGSISFEALKSENITISIRDSITHQALNPKLFDISFDIKHSYLYEDPVWYIENDSIIVLEIRPKGEWCECLFPEGLDMEMVSTPKNGAFKEYGKNYCKTIFPMHVTVVKDRPWLSRCLWVLISLLALFILIWYLRGLLKKNRFHKQARMKNSYVVEDNPKEIEKNGRPMRRSGFGAWIDRWLNPFGDERNTISFSRPKTKSMTFTASSSKNRILMSEASFNQETMIVPNYTPRPKGDRKKTEEPISISSGISIEIKKTQAGATTRLGHITYVVEEGKDDESGYRIFISLFMIAAILAFITLVVLLALSF